MRIPYLLSGCVALSMLAWIVNTIPPKQGSVIAIGIFLITIIIFSFLAAFTKNVRRCILWSSGVGVVLILRAVNLHDFIYIVLLVILLISIEIALKKR